MVRFELNPLTRRRLNRFRAMRRGWWSFWILAFFAVLAALGPVVVSHRAVAVRYEGRWWFPSFGDDIPGTTFGLGYGYETNYRALREKFRTEGGDNRVWMPLIPFGPTEFCEVYQPVESRGGKLYAAGEAAPLDETRVFTLSETGAPARSWRVTAGEPDGEMRGYDEHGVVNERGAWERGRRVAWRATGPGAAKRPPELPEAGRLRAYVVNPAPPGAGGHVLGTDESGRDVAARLFGGFRILMVAAALYLTFTYTVGCAVGCAMGWFGGWFDLATQRAIEVWSNIPRLYVIIFLSAVLVAAPGAAGFAHRLGVTESAVRVVVLMLVLVSYSWIGPAAHLRTATWREKHREYVYAARLLGAGSLRIVFRHILPNALSTLVTFAPFTVIELVGAMTALDFLGFGLPPSEPTWGELLRQGTENFDKPWIIGSVSVAMVTLLLLVSFVGEAIREVYEPRRHTVYA